MAKTRVTQASVNPTRKLSASTITSALMGVSGLIVMNLWPSWFSATVWLAMTPLVQYVVGFVVADDANVVVVQPVVETEVET